MAVLQNCSNRPLTFSLDHNMCSTLAEAVTVVPSCGFLYPGSHQILILSSNPTELSPRQEFNISLQLNAAENAMVQSTHIRGQTTIAVFVFFCFFIFTTVAFRSWKLPMGWKSCLCLWTKMAACISSLQWWAQVQIATIASGTSVISLYGWLAWCLSQLALYWSTLG